MFMRKLQKSLSNRDFRLFFWTIRRRAETALTLTEELEEFEELKLLTKCPVSERLTQHNKKNFP
jgi:hypothetical protein